MTDEPKYIDQSLPKFTKPVADLIVHPFETMVNRAISAVITNGKPAPRSVFDVVKSAALIGPIKYVTFLKFTGIRTKTKIIKGLLTTFAVDKDADLEAPKTPALVFLDNPRAVKLDKAFARILKSSSFQESVRAAKEDMELNFNRERQAFNSYVEGSLNA